MDVIKIENGDFERRAYECQLKGPGVVGRLSVEWLDRIQAYLMYRGGCVGMFQESTVSKGRTGDTSAMTTTSSRVKGGN